MPTDNGKKPKPKKTSKSPATRPLAGRSGGKWTKGQSGNPSGKNASVPEVREFLRSQSIPAAQVLAAIVCGRSSSDRDRIAAAKVLLDFSVPRPRDAGETSTADALALLAAALRPAAAPAPAPPAPTDASE